MPVGPGITVHPPRPAPPVGSLHRPGKRRPRPERPRLPPQPRRHARQEQDHSPTRGSGRTGLADPSPGG
ncbi:MAG: hypothetical protein DIU69_08365 [Bacillota bacterium]|nr:MAG: hypothetical protein DIU69_08365 [Bacillota bacterium]